MTGLAFAAPMALLALVALPAIWWLLKATPPRPVTALFPPFALLKPPKRMAETPVRTPWWLILLRLVMAAAVILAASGPTLGPPERLLTGSGPLWLMIDNGPTAAPDWPARLATASAALTAAGDAGRPVLLIATADGPEHIGVQTTADEALKRLNAIGPRGHFADRMALADRLESLARATPPGEIVALIETADDGDSSRFLPRLKTIAGAAPLTLVESQVSAPIVIDGLDQDGSVVTAHLRRAVAGAAIEGKLRLSDRKGRLLDERPFAFAAGAAKTDLRFDLPLEIRNDIARAEVVGGGSALGVHLTDDRWRRRAAAIVTVTGSDSARPLIAPDYFLDKALSPYVDLVPVGSGALSEMLRTATERRPSAIFLADAGRLGSEDAALARTFMEKGGVFVRFAGPRLASADETLVPTPLRRGDRALGGSLSWSKPQALGGFAEAGPFAGLAVPTDVTVTRQVLAEPTFDLPGLTWASLADGTPLVTAARVGEGWLVLFHVTADTRWSNLPISGSFVDMLRRIVALGAAGGGDTAVDGKTVRPPLSLMDGFGRPESARAGVRGLSDTTIDTLPPSRERPPGLYGTADDFRALNPMRADMAYGPLDTSGLGADVRRAGLIGAERVDLAPWALLIALLLLLSDGIAVTALSGGFRRRTVPKMLAILLAIGLVTGIATPRAEAADDAHLLDALSATRLAYVETGIADIDEASRSGLSALSTFIGSHTSLEPGEPMAVDPASDELAVFPLIYWPIDAAAPQPTAEAMTRIEAFMKNGGTVLFDTRDDADLSATSANTLRLRQMLSMIDVPPLEPVPTDHVLTKAFYLLGNFVGRTENSPLWVEAGDDGEADSDRPVRAGDGVSSILITGNDLAGAWATDDSGAFLYPLVPGTERQRDFAFRAGVNIVMYVLTGNYKADQVHVPALLQRLGQ